jgi:hypothetical protein
MDKMKAYTKRTGSEASEGVSLSKQMSLKCKALGTRFNARNYIPDPGLQELLNIVMIVVLPLVLLTTLFYKMHAMVLHNCLKPSTK